MIAAKMAGMEGLYIVMILAKIGRAPANVVIQEAIKMRNTLLPDKLKKALELLMHAQLCETVDENDTWEYAPELPETKPKTPIPIPTVLLRMEIEQRDRHKIEDINNNTKYLRLCVRKFQTLIRDQFIIDHAVARGSSKVMEAVLRAVRRKSMHPLIDTDSRKARSFIVIKYTETPHSSLRDDRGSE